MSAELAPSLRPACSLSAGEVRAPTLHEVPNGHGACRRIFQSLLLQVVLCLTGLDRLPGQDAAPTEYQVKAAFLYNFAKFVDWPSAAFTDAETPFMIGVIGETPIEDELARVVRNKRINGHPLAIKRIADPAGVTSCHILFISNSQRRRLADILRAARRGSVLTVSDLDHFLSTGGIIQFLMEENRVRFAINDSAAREVGLRISSKLLNLARRPDPE